MNTWSCSAATDMLLSNSRVSSTHTPKYSTENNDIGNSLTQPTAIGLQPFTLIARLPSAHPVPLQVGDLSFLPFTLKICEQFNSSCEPTAADFWPWHFLVTRERGRPKKTW